MNGFLLDTHVILWWATGSERLNAEALAAIEGDHRVCISAASAWELGIKRASGKLNFPDSLVPSLKARGIELLPIVFESALAAGSLPRFHGDPFDRLLVHQANEHDLTLITHDTKIQRYDVRVLKT